MRFNYYFAGTHRKTINSYLIENDCLRLLSYYYPHSKIDYWIENGGSRLFLDSGAFTAHTKGIKN